MLEIARVLSKRGTCVKLEVGCVLTDINGVILSTGYNGVPRSMAHCIAGPCAGASAPKGADLCEAVHAETNALLACPDVNKIHVCYTTHVPCMRCMKELLNTSCKTIFYLHDEFEEVAAVGLWQRGGRYIYKGAIDD